jgi:hypothetical protein
MEDDEVDQYNEWCKEVDSTKRVSFMYRLHSNILEFEDKCLLSWSHGSLRHGTVGSSFHPNFEEGGVQP